MFLSIFKNNLKNKKKVGIWSMFIGLSYLSLFEFIDGIVQFIDLVYTRRLIDKFYLKRLKKKMVNLYYIKMA
jgi:hypothetical protein